MSEGFWDSIAGPLVVAITGAIVSAALAYFVAKVTTKREMKGLLAAERVHGVYPRGLQLIGVGSVMTDPLERSDHEQPAPV